MGRPKLCKCERRDKDLGWRRTSCKSCSLRAKRFHVLMTIVTIIILSMAGGIIYGMVIDSPAIFCHRIGIVNIIIAIVAFIVQHYKKPCEIGTGCVYCYHEPNRKMYRSIFNFFGCRFLGDQFKKPKTN